MIAQSHQVKEKRKSIHNTDIFPGKISAQNPSIFYCIFNQGTMKQLQCTLLTRAYCTLTMVSHRPRQNRPRLSQFLASGHPSFLAQFMWNVIPIL